MTPKEAEKIYGKRITSQIWESFDLSELEVDYGPEGIDIPDYLWEERYYLLSQ